jgi:hypothetical protein
VNSAQYPSYLDGTKLKQIQFHSPVVLVVAEVVHEGGWHVDLPLQVRRAHEVVTGTRLQKENAV